MPARAPKKEPIPHDQIFKVAFQLFFPDFLEIVEPRLARLLDLSKLKFIDKEAFTDLPGGQRADLDLVAETRTRRGKPRPVLLHVETEGKFRRATARRLWRYAMHLMLKYGQPVITIVVFLKGGPPDVEWCEVVEKVGPFEVVRFRYLAFGLSRSLAERYLERPQPLVGALAALMRSEVWDRVEQKLRCYEKIGQADLDGARRFVLTTVVKTYIQLEGGEAERFATEIRRHPNPEVRKMVITWDEALEERQTLGEARGKEVGKAEGRAEGELLGQLKTLRRNIQRLLQKRFGRRGEEIETRLLAIADPQKLDELFEKALEARSLDELGLEP